MNVPGLFRRFPAKAGTYLSALRELEKWTPLSPGSDLESVAHRFSQFSYCSGAPRHGHKFCGLITIDAGMSLPTINGRSTCERNRHTLSSPRTHLASKSAYTRYTAEMSWIEGPRRRMVEVWRHKPGSSAERVLTARLRSDRTGIGEGFDFDYHLTPPEEVL